MRPPASCESCPHGKRGLFGVLPSRELHELGTRKRASLYKKGQLVFHEGTTPAGLFCVFSGAVKVAKPGPAGREQIVRLAHPGDVLGYRALFADDPYTATAVALEDSLLCFMPRDAGADLIALATHGRSGLGRLLHGSVATEVLQRADVPVLLLRREERRAA